MVVSGGRHAAARRLACGTPQTRRCCYATQDGDWTLCRKAPELMALWHFEFRHEFGNFFARRLALHRTYGDERQQTNDFSKQWRSFAESMNMTEESIDCWRAIGPELRNSLPL